MLEAAVPTPSTHQHPTHEKRKKTEDYEGQITS